MRRQLDLVATVGARTDDERLSLAVPDAALEAMRCRLRALGLIDGERPWAVLHPGSTAASRRYPPELYAEASRRLVERHGWSLVLTGSADERALTAGIAQRAGVRLHDLAGALDLAELAALLALAPLAIVNNTARPRGSGCRDPVVSLYPLTNPQHTPWQVPTRVLSNDVPCRWCCRSVCPEGHHACLRGVPPEAVVTAALELAQGRQAAAGGAPLRLLT